MFVKRQSLLPLSDLVPVSGTKEGADLMTVRRGARVQGVVSVRQLQF